MFAKGVLSALLITAVLPIAFANNHYQPATFREKHNPLKHITYPGVDGDHDVVVRCAGLASPRGYLYQGYCLDDGKIDTRFHEAVREAIHKARTTTPKADRWRKFVWFQYSIRFVKRGDTRDVMAYPHWLLNDELFGTADYTGPQEIPLQLLSPPRCQKKKVFWVSLAIDHRGQVSDVDFLNHGLSDSCQSRFLRYISKQRFIPAYMDGEPVPSRSVDVYFANNPKRATRGGRDRDFILVDSAVLDHYIAQNEL